MFTNFNIPVSLGDPIFLIDDINKSHINQLTVTFIRINLDGSWSAGCKRNCYCNPLTFSERDINNSVFLDYDRALLVLSVINPNAYGLSYPKFPFSVNQKVYRINYEVFPYRIEEILIYRIECDIFYHIFDKNNHGIWGDIRTAQKNLFSSKEDAEKQLKLKCEE